MRAAQFPALNQLSLVEMPEPKPASGEVLVVLRAAALNHRDVWIRAGQYAGVSFPCVPGSDGAGVVVAVGESVDPSWIGREVVIYPSFGWGSNQRAQGPQFSILGLPRQGTLAGKIAVPAIQLAPKPALPLAGLTAYRAVFSRAGLEPGERILLSGIGGGVALFALQFAHAIGAEAWVTSSSSDKIARAVTLGAKGGFDYRDSSWVKSAAKAPGLFDVIIDSAGGEGFAALIDAVAPGGRIAFFGATRGDAALPVRKVYWRQISLLGTTMGSPADWEAMLAFVAKHQLRPIVSEVFPLERIHDAFALMEQGRQFGKIVVTLGS